MYKMEYREEDDIKSNLMKGKKEKVRSDLWKKRKRNRSNKKSKMPNHELASTVTYSIYSMHIV